MPTAQQLEEQINELTIQLKEMIGTEQNYGEIWDRRVDLKRELDNLKTN